MRLPRFKGRDRVLLMLLPHLRRPQRLVSFTLPSGLKITGDLGDEIDAQLYVYGVFDPQLVGVLGRCLKRGQAFVDAGANIGYLSLEGALRVGPEGIVHAFEPNPRAVRRLEANVVANGFRNVHWHPVALGCEATLAELYEDFEYRSADSSLRRRGRASGSSVKVPQERLDDALGNAHATPPNVIKVDVEGAELDVLRGGMTVLASARPILILEHNRVTSQLFGYEPEEMLTWLHDRYQYTFFWIGIEGLVPYEGAVDDPGFFGSAQNLLGIQGTRDAGIVADLQARYPTPPPSYARLELWPPGPMSVSRSRRRAS